jgi:phosphoenolpyruvate phosphomutase
LAISHYLWKESIMKKTRQLKELLLSSSLEFVLEAHNGLSAKIVEEAGFSGIWASGLSISAALGVRDCNEASWTQVLEVVEFMCDGTTIPVLLDADTGYGNFNNARRLVKKLEQRDVAGMCIEDKLFPKSNSLLAGGRNPLADKEEFCGKIKAAKDTQNDPDFCVVARTEAFIAGWGLEEALERAESYCNAGADAILVHSKLNTFAEIKSFMDHWKLPCPVVIVPTKYHTTPSPEFEKAGVSLVIWANHLLRASLKAMQDTAARICKDKTLMGVEEGIASVEEVFRLQDVEELKRAEAQYLVTGCADK